MKYLVMHPFTSYGVFFHRNEVIDESVIRSPRLRQSEGKILPIVPEQEVIPQPVVQPEIPVVPVETAVSSSDKAAQEDTPPEQPIKALFTFK